LNFFSISQTKQVAKHTLKSSERNKVSFVKHVGVQNIIGFRANGNGSVRGVVSEQLYEAEQSCNLLSYLFINGTYAWLL
jgi:hypothetical protein